MQQKYYLAVMLVEATSVEQLVAKLIKGKYKSSEEIREKCAFCGDFGFLGRVDVFSVGRDSDQDDDIVAGAQKMSLKCPVRLDVLLSPLVLILTSRSAHDATNHHAVSVISMRASAMF